MAETSLNGAQKAKLRGMGQRLDASIQLGRDGLTPAFLTELNRAFRTAELIKLRFTADQDRHARAALCEQIETTADCVCVGSVGRTALFHRSKPEGAPNS